MEPITISNRKQDHHGPQQGTHGFASHSPITPPAYFHSHQPGSNAALSGKGYQIFLGVADEQGTGDGRVIHEQNYAFVFVFVFVMFCFSPEHFFLLFWQVREIIWKIAIH